MNAISLSRRAAAGVGGWDGDSPYYHITEADAQPVDLDAECRAVCIPTSTREDASSAVFQSYAVRPPHPRVHDAGPPTATSSPRGCPPSSTRASQTRASRTSALSGACRCEQSLFTPPAVNRRAGRRRRAVGAARRRRRADGAAAQVGRSAALRVCWPRRNVRERAHVRHCRGQRPPCSGRSRFVQ